MVDGQRAADADSGRRLVAANRLAATRHEVVERPPDGLTQRRDLGELPVKVGPVHGLEF
jgi:hypothetical protein